MEDYCLFINRKYPNEKSVNIALEILDDWINDKVKMWEARKYCWPVLKFARKIEENDKPICQLARACSHALATCHVKTHAEGVTIYTLSYLDYLDKSLTDLEKELKRQTTLLENLCLSTKV